MTEWFLTAEAIHEAIPLIGISLTIAIIIFVAVMITRKIVKNGYEELLENRINEISDNIIDKYKNKIEEVGTLQEKLKNEKVSKKQVLKLLADVLGKLNE